MKKPIRKLFFCLDTALMGGAAILRGAASLILPGLYVASSSALCMNVATGEILYGKAIDKQQFPASTTKVMTALLLTEYAKQGRWEDSVIISEKAVREIGIGASNIGLSPGDSLTLKDCLYAIMLASANEVCAAVAEHIAGSSESFAQMMNERAMKAGAKSVHFTNSHGLHDKDHVTTAMDIALIMGEAVKERAFVDAISAKAYTVFIDNEPIGIRNKNLLIQEGVYRRDYVIGGKTGYTNAARHTLVNYAVTDGLELICVALRAPNYMTYPDTIALFEYGFARSGKFMGAEEEEEKVSS